MSKKTFHSAKYSARKNKQLDELEHHLSAENNPERVKTAHLEADSC